MIEISIVYDNEKQVEKVREFNNNSLTFNFIDINTRKGKKSGWALKNHWGASLNPFVLVVKENKPIKAFYSEACNAIDKLIEYLKIEFLL